MSHPHHWKLFSSRRPSVELDWAREKKVLDADPTMVIFVISIWPNSFIYSKFWSILYSSNIQITGKTVFEEDGEGGYRSGRNLLFILIKCMWNPVYTGNIFLCFYPQVKMFLVVALAYIIFWGPLFTVSLYDLSINVELLILILNI